MSASLYSRRMARVAPSAIMELIKATAAGDYISFASGLPDPKLFPVDRIRGIADDVLARDGQAALQYGAAEGYGPLRDLTAAILRKRGLPGSAENILITSGSQQALDLAARALLNAGDRVVIEDPSYLAAIQTFDSYEADYVTLPLDEHGMTLGGLPVTAKLLYTLPNFQNPTGATMAEERRQYLARWAARAGAAVLEDDAYYDLRYDGQASPPVCSLAENPWALYSGTFSKTIAPGLRTGYVWGRPELIARLANLKQITDLHSGSLTQRIVYEYCASGCLEPGVEALRNAYRPRRDAMLDALGEHAADLLTWTRPQGGMFVFAALPRGRDAAGLLERVMKSGVVFVPGASFHAAGGGANTLRLNFVSEDEPRIREGVRRLAETARTLTAEPGA